MIKILKNLKSSIPVSEKEIKHHILYIRENINFDGSIYHYDEKQFFVNGNFENLDVTNFTIGGNDVLGDISTALAEIIGGE